MTILIQNDTDREDLIELVRAAQGGDRDAFGRLVERFQPMVFAMGWALAFATVLTLIVLPCAMLILDDARRLLYWLYGKIRTIFGLTRILPNRA